MGKKSNAKSKEKRMQRKEEQQRISLAMATVNAANKLQDPMEPFPVFRKFDKNGLQVELYVKRVNELEEPIRKWIFDLTKRNMQSRYEQSSWGWNDTKKWEELTDDAAWYLLAKTVDGIHVGFSHFRFDMDEGVEVLYCYELQLESVVQRKGLGKFMMQILELMAFKNNMKKVVLTVLKNNPNSRFFKAMNYELDETSPIDDEDETHSYEILSKINKRLIAKINSVACVQNGKVPALGHHCCSGHH